MIENSVHSLFVDDCADPFRLLAEFATSSGWDDSMIRRHNQNEDATRWFFATSLGKEVLASLTWRTFADDREASNFEPVGPVLRIAGNDSYKLTFIMPLRCPRRGEAGELFLLVRGWRVTLGADPNPGEPSEEWDDTRVEWAIIGRDPSKPRSCNFAVLHEARAVIEQQVHDNPRWCSAWA